MELVSFFEKISNLSYSYPSNHIENDIMQNHEQKQKLKKKMKTQDSIGKTNLFFGTLPFSPHVILAMWLHVRVP
jgi:hypothetical protein